MDSFYNMKTQLTIIHNSMVHLTPHHSLSHANTSDMMFKNHEGNSVINLFLWVCSMVPDSHVVSKQFRHQKKQVSPRAHV